MVLGEAALAMRSKTGGIGRWWSTVGRPEEVCARARWCEIEKRSADKDNHLIFPFSARKKRRGAVALPPPYRKPQDTTTRAHDMALEYCASFEPDEHLATLVLRHVGNVCDRLALECVSRVWRAAGQIPGAWQLQDLTLTGDRLTDARVRKVLRRVSPNLRSLVVNDAPAASTGEGLLAYAGQIHQARAGATAGVAVEHGLPTPGPAFARLRHFSGDFGASKALPIDRFHTVIADKP